jgi:hypothetical protein
MWYFTDVRVALILYTLPLGVYVWFDLGAWIARLILF